MAIVQEITPAIWLWPQETPAFARFKLNQRELSTGSLKVTHHVEDVNLEITNTDAVNQLAYGGHNMFIEEARYWLMQDTINFSAASPTIENGTSVIVGPGPFFETFEDVDGYGIVAVIAQPTAGPESDASKRLGGAPFLGRYGWLALCNNIHAESPKWITIDGQLFPAKTRITAVHGYMKEHCQCQLTPMIRRNTQLAYAFRDGLEQITNQIGPYPPWYVI